MGLTKGKVITYAAVVLAFCAVFVSKISAQQQSKEYVNRPAPMVHFSGLLRVLETIQLITACYINHIIYTLKNDHLFLSAENNKEIVVVAMKAGIVIHETKVGGNRRKPFFDPTTNELWQSSLFFMKF
jgi:hypothetical protein